MLELTTAQSALAFLIAAGAVLLITVAGTLLMEGIGGACRGLFSLIRAIVECIAWRIERRYKPRRRRKKGPRA